MSAHSHAIDAFLGETLNPILKREGFRKKRRLYRHVLENRAELIMIEASSWNYDELAEFTASLALVESNLASQLCGRTVNPLTAGMFEGAINTSLGRLMPGRLQDRWKVNLTADNSEEASRFRAAIEDIALPWFRKIRTEEGLIDALTYDQSLASLRTLVIIYTARNQADRAHATVTEILRRRPDLVDDTQHLLKIGTR